MSAWSIVTAPTSRSTSSYNSCGARHSCLAGQTGMSGPTENRSDIDDHFRFPLIAHLVDAQAVIRDRLHLVFEIVARAIERLAPGGRGQAVGAHVDLELAEEQMLGVEVIEQLA